MNTTEQIQIQAMTSAQSHIEQGWTSPGSAYDLGANFGDTEALEARIGRAATKEERLTLERLIRVWLDSDGDEASLRADIEAAS